MKRHAMKNSHSKALFRNTAGSRHVHPKNVTRTPMRGGIRM